MSIGLITRGDDYGSFQSANRAIVDAYEHGILKNASVMAPAPAFEHGVRLLKEKPGLCLGLHMTFSSEWLAPRWGPITPPEKVPSLVDENGLFLDKPMTIHQRRVVLDELILESKAQLARARAAGLKIHYVDEHMGVGWIHPEGRPDQRFQDFLQEWCKKEGLVWHQGVQFELPKIPATDLPLREMYLQRIAQIKAPGAYLLMTHPTYDDAEMAPVVHPNWPAGSIGRRRQADHDLLCDSIFIQALKERDVQPITYVEAAQKRF